jgi:hypothetical protein
VFLARRWVSVNDRPGSVVLAPPAGRFHIDDVDAGVIEWLAIGLAVAAIVVILRYRRRPRCERCAATIEVRSTPIAAAAEAEWPSVAAPEGDWTAISWKADHAGSPLPQRDVGSLN